MSDVAEAISGAAAARLRSYVERIERLEAQRKALAEDIKDVFAAAKASGFDAGPLRQVIADRRKEPAELEERETTVELYRRALGM